MRIVRVPLMLIPSLDAVRPCAKRLTTSVPLFYSGLMFTAQAHLSFLSHVAGALPALLLLRVAR